MSIFHELAANRRKAHLAKQTWGVFRVCKSGELAKVPTVRCTDVEEAIDKCLYLMRVNPGRTYDVQELR